MVIVYFDDCVTVLYQEDLFSCGFCNLHTSVRTNSAQPAVTNVPRTITFKNKIFRLWCVFF